MTDLLPLLQDFYREKLLMMLEHQAGARLIGQYDANNTYQYIISREETQLTWVATAIAELGGTAADVSEPARPERRLLLVELQEQLEEVGGLHEFCFSLQVMQTRVHGMAFSRAAAISSPQSRHTP